MSTATQIGKALAKGHDKLREIFLLPDITLKTLTGSGAPYTLTATYTNDWYLSKYEYTDMVSGKKFKWLRVEDLDGTRLAKLKTMTAVQIGTVVYKFFAKDSFIGAVPSYEFKVYPTGEQV